MWCAMLGFYITRKFEDLIRNKLFNNKIGFTTVNPIWWVVVQRGFYLLKDIFLKISLLGDKTIRKYEPFILTWQDF